MKARAQRCATCRFSTMVEVYQDVERECRRFPPLPSEDAVSRGREFPTVSDKDWCGEWRGKAAAKKEKR